MTFDYDQLDPGIREIVRRLHRAKFVTTDSGDGKTKQPGEGVLPFPHVFIRSTLELMTSDIGRLQAFLAGHGTLDKARVEASYDSDDGIVILGVSWS